VGDRKEDQLVAQRAGIPFIAVLTGPESRQGFPAPGALHVLDSISELPALLDHKGAPLSAPAQD
jgi:phosphoglycolate phosphatase-like HAD superfamily hydrolase